MADGFAIEGKCEKCGGTAFTAPDNAADSDWITCDGCGQRIMTWGAYKSGALKLAVSAAKKSFGKIKGFKTR